MKKIILPLFIASGFLFPGCYYDKVDELFPSQTPCDSSLVVSYSEHVAPILNGYCVSCHSSAAGGGGISLATYDNVLVQAQSGKLMGVILQSQGFKPMPPVGKLDACKTRTIQKWIEAGSPNN